MALPLPPTQTMAPEMTSSAQQTVQTQNTPVIKPEGVPPAKKKLYDDFRTRIDACKSYRRKLVSTWTANIDMRRGKPFASQTDEDRVVVNTDWFLTKAKHASLFSQVPQVRVSHPPQSLQAGPWVFTYEQRINDTLPVAGIKACMKEVIPDVINAAGIGGALVSHEAITRDKEVPLQDLSLLPPDIQNQTLTSGLLPDGTPLEMTVVPEVVDHRYTIARISPSDLLWPVNFTGSDFDQAEWVGRTGRITWAQAVQRFGLTDQDKENLLAEDKNLMDKLTHDVDKDKVSADDMIGFDEIFYKEFQYDSEATSFSAIHHLVFIHGKEIPVVDEPWKGQSVRPAPDGTEQLIGALKYPLRLLTLTYITDETIPPSDSAIGRPQTNEINKARTQMMLQRERSLPVRWYDVNRIDPSISQSLMRGTWQAMIPVQGNGQNVLGEVARAVMPQENFAFDKIAKSDLNEAWSLGPNQVGSGSDVDTKGEAQLLESNYQTRIGMERAAVAEFFCSIAEVLGGLLALYEQPESFGEGFDPSISRTLSYSILADSTLLLDSNQRLKRLIDFFNFAAKTGWVNPEPVLKEIASLSGLDPNSVIMPPQPKAPEVPNISLRLTGQEDMMNPLMLAFLLKSGQAPPPELIDQAKDLISMVVTPAPAQEPIPPMIGPNGEIVPQQQPPPAPPLINLDKTPVPQMEVPKPPPAGMGEAHPELSAMPRINKRAGDK